jgi:predicted phage gp36 major capsid-like protein
MTPRMLAWQQFVRVVLVLTAFFAVAGSVHAQLPPDQRRQMRQEMREQWQQMPQEDRQRFRDERRERWQQMPQEDRQRMRDEMRGRRDEAGGQGMRQGGGFRGGRP